MSSQVELSKEKDTIKCVTPQLDEENKLKTQIIPLARLNSIEVYGNIKISTPLLKLCNTLKIPCYFYSYYGKPIGQFIPENPIPCIVRLKQYEVYLNNHKRISIAKAIVRKTSQERLNLINKFDKDNLCVNYITHIIKYNNKINLVKTISELRGLEGNIMKNFFESFSKLLYQLPFEGRSRRPPRDEANSILSFGNVLLYNTVHAEIYKCSLDPLVGFLHDPHENRNSLAVDIAEMFRPLIVDNLILRLDHKRTLLPCHFDKDQFKCYLNQKGKKIWINEYKKFLRSSIQYTPLKRYISLKEEIKLECYNLVKYITGEKDEYNPITFKNW